MSHRAFLLLCAHRLLKQDCIALTWSAYRLKRQVNRSVALPYLLFSVYFLERYLQMFCGLQDPDGRQRINYVTVFERPGLHEFLQRTSEFADLVLFTAGLEGLISSAIFYLLTTKSLVNFTPHATDLCSYPGYAKPLVDRIDAHNRFTHRLYRPSTVTT